MLIQDHCLPWPIVTMSVLECRPEVTKNLEERYPERTKVVGSVPQWDSKVQWVRRATRIPFVIVKGKKVHSYGFLYSPSLALSPPCH